MAIRQLAIAAALMCAAASANAQQLEWTQTLNLPKGLNMPEGVKADMLGIETGASYREVKSVLQKLVSEAPPAEKKAEPEPKTKEEMTAQIMRKYASQGMGSKPRPAFEESEMRLTFPVSPPITATYVGRITVRRELPGSTPRTIPETITVFLSSPASGQQVVAVTRGVRYPERTDQPRISETISALKEKFKAEPRIEKDNQRTTASVVFSKGAVSADKSPYVIVCGGPSMSYQSIEARTVPDINPKRACDVTLHIVFQHGISEDHAQSASFELIDPQRMKEDYIADFAYFDQVVKKALQTKAPPPKL